MADPEAVKSLSGLLTGISRELFHLTDGHAAEVTAEVTEEALRSQLFPETPREHFTPLYLKMTSLLKSIATADMDPVQLEAFLTAQRRKQGGGGGVTPEQAAALSGFWRSQRLRVRERLLDQNRWEPGLRGLTWRVDLQAAASTADSAHSAPVALLQLELGRAGQASDFVCLEFDESGINTMLKKMSDIQENVDRIVQVQDP